MQDSEHIDSKSGHLVRIDNEKGESHWYLDGKRHRTDGPAVILPNGSKHWFLNGRRHRDDGPAIFRSNGTLHRYRNGGLQPGEGPGVEK